MECLAFSVESSGVLLVESFGRVRERFLKKYLILGMKACRCRENCVILQVFVWEEDWGWCREGIEKE